MKINLTNLILYCVLGVCLLTAMLFCVQTISANGDYRNYNGRATAINNWQNTVKALAIDCVEYSKKNPAIIPILEQAGVLGNKPMAPATTKPATK